MHRGKKTHLAINIMRIKQLIITALLILAETSLSAQHKKFLFGIGSSLDFNSYGFVGNTGPIESNGKIGYSAGLTVRYQLNDKIWLDSRLLYSKKSYEER